MMKKIPPHFDDVTKEILSKGKDVIKDFDDSQGIDVQPRTLRNKLISIRLPMIMISNLRIIARARGDIGYQQIIKTYVSEGLERDFQKAQFNTSFQGYFSDSTFTESHSLEWNSSWQKGRNFLVPR